jgi:hypothetical protein
MTEVAHDAPAFPVGRLTGTVSRASDIWECDGCGARAEPATPTFCDSCGRPMRLHPAGVHDEVELEVYSDGSVKEIVGEGHLESGLVAGGRNWSVKGNGGEE